MTDRDEKPQSKDVRLLVAAEPTTAEPEPRVADPGERPSFPAVFRAEASYVALSLRRLGVRERDLEDVTHDVFVVVHRHLDRYDPERPLRPWLFGIASRVALGYRRRSGHQLEIVHAEIEAPDRAPLADEQLDDRQRRQLVLRALESMSGDKKAVFILHDIDGHAMPEVASALAIPLNTGYSRLRLARVEFAAAVARILERKGTP